MIGCSSDLNEHRNIMNNYSHVVVGAGIVGSWTALHLRNLGKKVLLLEQFKEPHTRGSSHGQSRLIRSCYIEKHFAEMMPHALKMWKNLEEDFGKTIFLNVGALCISKSPQSEKYKNCISNMKNFSPGSMNELRFEDIQSKFSKMLSYDKQQGFLLDKTAGVLLAHKAVLTVQETFMQRGGHLWDNCQVSKLETNGDEVKLVTSKGNVTAKSAVVCAGTWTQKLLVPHLISSLPLQPQAVKVFYWKIKENDVYSVSSGFPALLELEGDIYALPSYEYPGLLKVCYHGGVPCDPDKRDQAPSDPKFENAIKDYIKKHLPLLETEPAIIENCMYTVTPDETFIIDKLPGQKNIVLGAGFSGTGFKTSPAVGKLLSELASGTNPFLDLSPFRLSRFLKE